MGWVGAVMVSVTACFDMAKRRRRDAEGWSLLAGLLGPLAVLALYLLGEAAPQTREQRLRSARSSAVLSSVILLAFVGLMATSFVKACFKL